MLVCDEGRSYLLKQGRLKLSWPEEQELAEEEWGLCFEHWGQPVQSWGAGL